MRTCFRCGATFTRRNPGPKRPGAPPRVPRYCGLACSRAVQAERAQDPVRKCSQCGEAKFFTAFGMRTNGVWYRSKCLACERENGKQYGRAHPDKVRAANRRGGLRRLGTTEAEYERLLIEQDGGCAICGSTSSRSAGRKFLMVDHDHATGAIRGLLCHPCNAGIGYFADNTERLRKAAGYLEERKVHLGHRDERGRY